MNRALSIFLAGILLIALPAPAYAATVIFLTDTAITSFTIPSNWTTTNTIECIGSGGNGRIGSINQSRGGGGGGAYALVSNLEISGSITYAIAQGGTFSTGTYFNGTASTSASVSCQSGKTPLILNGGAGGTTAGSIGTIKFAGGVGGAGSSGICPGGENGGGGGGAGGPRGAGIDGTFGSGGAGGAGFGGASSGASGQEWNYFSFGIGSGAGGDGGFGGGGAGGDGGSYGGGGGGGGTDCVEGDTAGAGAQGLIVITYWPTLSSMVKIFGGKVQIQGGRTKIY